VLSGGRLGDTQLVGRGRDRANSDVGAQDLELAAGLEVVASFKAAAVKLLAVTG